MFSEKEAITVEKIYREMFERFCLYTKIYHWIKKIQKSLNYKGNLWPLNFFHVFDFCHLFIFPMKTIRNSNHSFHVLSGMICFPPSLLRKFCFSLELLWAGLVWVVFWLRFVLSSFKQVKSPSDHISIFISSTIKGYIQSSTYLH